MSAFFSFSALFALFAAFLIVFLATAISCRRKETTPAAQKGRATATPVVRFTPMPDPPTPTVVPGQPTPPPDLPR